MARRVIIGVRNEPDAPKKLTEPIVYNNNLSGLGSWAGDVPTTNPVVGVRCLRRIFGNLKIEVVIRPFYGKFANRIGVLGAYCRQFTQKDM
jgi:hypothetical protein